MWVGIGIGIGFVAVVAGFVILRRPSIITRIRINLLWLSTLVAILTLAFGMKLIDILSTSNGGGEGSTNTSTIEIVLSSLVGVGIGGLIAIAGQLVQDSVSNDNSE